ncbi:MAG: multiheme c-type cytochrome [Rhodopirellula sp. JB044]|uniref:multiheme c-type cytochrome n=1 Tax=Rhodopirellula sp. JB044 TaxID=3342844 RepID=UPI003709DA0B
MSHPTNRSFIARHPWLLAVVAVGVLVAGGVMADYLRALPEDAVATFVGRDACVECHETETQAYTGSHHDMAMDLATDETVLGDFNDVTFVNDGIQSRLYRDGKKFMVYTEGPTGEMEDFEVKYVFGVDPLQQYMVEFERPEDAAEDEVGRVQVLRISWDTNRKEWFYLRPPDVGEKLQPDDPLHWTGIAQRWQTMCAECHSTDLKRNYDVATQRYHTTFSEIDVSCEACHGPASLHIELANRNSLFWDRHRGYALVNLKTEDTTPQIETCAPCHSRRGVLDGKMTPGAAYCDHYNLELLRGDTYHDDGQIKDEVYVYGSFLQSKMYHQGIRCTDCHDPHSLELKHPGNETCTSCHQHAAGKYDVPSHHHHPVGSEGAMCVNCHMPHTTYMAVDPRRDHSFRIPRPDLSVELKTPNACSGCHVEDLRDTLPAEISDDLKLYQDWLLAASQGYEKVSEVIERTDQWCDEACDKWYGEERLKPPHYAEAIAALRRGDRSGVRKTLKLIAGSNTDPKQALTPVIARATALDELVMQGRVEAVDAAEQLIDENERDPDSMHPILLASAARAIGMLGGGGAMDPGQVQKQLYPLLSHSSRLVRSEAARGIVNGNAYQRLSGAKRKELDQVLSDVKDEFMYASDRAGAHMGWAMLSEQRGQWAEAIRSYSNAMRVEPGTTGPRTNLAALLDRLIPMSPKDPSVREVLNAVGGEDGIAGVEKKITQLRREELPLLDRDAKLAPEIADLQYRYGLALYLSGDLPAARKQLQRAVELEPDVELFRTALRMLEEHMKNQ